jgi:GNAT superfamily N-acetyltransferase
MSFEVVVTDALDPEARDVIERGLVGFNALAGAPTKFRPLGVVVRTADGKALGGLWGWTAWDWLFVQLFWLPEALRGAGLGTTLLRRAEAEAVQRGCRGVWLDSFSFQAPEFYRQQGYEVFGALDDYPPGHRRVFLKKILT